MAEFILETSHPSRRIIRQTDNSSKYKFEEEFRSVIRLSTEFILETDYPLFRDFALMMHMLEIGSISRVDSLNVRNTMS